MKRIIFAGLVVVMILGLGMQDPGAADKKAVKRAVLDYVEGVYEVKPELIEKSVHENLAKVGFARRSAADAYRTIPMTYKQLVNLAAEYNLSGDIGDDAPKKVEILDLLNQTASIKLTASWGIDYMHLAKYDGKWKIIHVLWQTHPETAD